MTVEHPYSVSEAHGEAETLQDGRKDNDCRHPYSVSEAHGEAEHYKTEGRTMTVEHPYSLGAAQTLQDGRKHGLSSCRTSL
jgi:hypothetical protein